MRIWILVRGICWVCIRVGGETEAWMHEYYWLRSFYVVMSIFYYS